MLFRSGLKRLLQLLAGRRYLISPDGEADASYCLVTHSHVAAGILAVYLFRRDLVWHYTHATTDDNITLYKFSFIPPDDCSEDKDDIRPEIRELLDTLPGGDVDNDHELFISAFDLFCSGLPRIGTKKAG